MIKVILVDHETWADGAKRSCWQAKLIKWWTGEKRANHIALLDKQTIYELDTPESRKCILAQYEYRITDIIELDKTVDKFELGIKYSYLANLRNVIRKMPILRKFTKLLPKRNCVWYVVDSLGLPSYCYDMSPVALFEYIKMVRQ